NKLFTWNPQKDVIEYNGKSVIFQKIIDNTGYTKEALEKEFKTRTELLKKLVKNKITDFKLINEIFHTYIKDRTSLPKEYQV
ncbi:MAG: hypothetical protein KKE20_01310, partial [Nanoarchaeota archaeon]|nr:hypothetical protein [Nanoarchaeota archaeon]